jgi:hypothetical protein
VPAVLVLVANPSTELLTSGVTGNVPWPLRSTAEPSLSCALCTQMRQRYRDPNPTPCRAKAAVEAATAEVEGARQGNGRDGSGRSLKQRLEDAKQAQVGC